MLAEWYLGLFTGIPNRKKKFLQRMHSYHTTPKVTDQDLILATTQSEETFENPISTVNVTTTSNTSVMKKMTPTTTFTNCSFGSIGTLNIHITGRERLIRTRLIRSST